MRLSDLLKLAYSNLKRRKTRTLLTVLGVVIGTASIVVMVGLGLGMSQSLMSTIESIADISTITVNNYGDMGNGKKKLELTDESIQSFSYLPHVTGSTPVLEVGVEAKCGAYNGYLSIQGVSQSYLERLKVGSGEIPKPNQPELTLLYGNQVGRSFYKNGNWEESSNLDMEKETIFYSFPKGMSTQSEDTAMDAGTNSGKKYILKAAGVLEGGEEDYSMTSMSAFADLDTLKTFLRRIYKKNLVPNPATNKKGKPLRYYVYNTAYVFVDKMDNVTAVQQMITDQGYQCYSNVEWIKQNMQTMRTTQMVLGGIGAVSLLVAAIGIMNTMMMSIYERTKEIGVMKVLGCDMRDIRNMFLTESAIIGLVGGIMGLLLSFCIAFLLNSFAANSTAAMMMGLGGEGSKLAVIPFWLSVFAIAFAVLIGTVSGYLPAVRAMKLSPLAAIRNE